MRAKQPTARTKGRKMKEIIHIEKLRRGDMGMTIEEIANRHGGLVITETAEASDALREHVMRLSFELSSDMLSEALDLIFKADVANDGRFTSAQFDRLAAIAATTAGRKVRAC
jgi:hypothetical protein